MTAHTATTARDGVLELINTAWLASGTTSSISMLWDNVRIREDDLSAAQFDARGNAKPYARTTVRTIISTAESIGNPPAGKFLTEGRLRVQIFTPPGDGHALADAAVEVLKAALRGASVGTLWFFNVFPNEIGIEDKWFRVDLVASFRYEER